MDFKNDSSQSIVVSGRIDKSKLKENEYTVSLMNEAYRNGLMRLEDINSMQLQVMLILKELINRYTRGESSSVSVYTAESIINSIFYCLDAFALGCDSPEEAIRLLVSEKLKRLYEKGVKQVKQWFDEACDIYRDVRKSKLSVGLESYDHTINEDIPLFFRNYGVVFDSHNMAASIDYQLAFDDMSIRGVLYIKNYLENLRIENLFCSNFNVREIERLLYDFGRTLGIDYRIELINIFELVFNNAVFSILAGSTVGCLGISKTRFELLNGKLKALGEQEIGEVIEQAVEKLIIYYNISGPGTPDYLNRYKKVFVQRVKSSVENDSLDSIIITENEEKKKDYAYLFENGRQMKSSDFNLFLKKLMQLEKPEEKACFIKSGISSLNDFIDILTSDCLYGCEFEVLFNTLGDMELAILSKMVFYEELRGDFTGLSHVVSKVKDREPEWHGHFVEFLRNAGSGRLKKIEGLLGEIDYKEISFY